MFGVRRDDEFLEGRLFESVDSEEWYDDRWSTDSTEDDRAGLGDHGVRVADVDSDANVWVSSVSVEPLTNFLLD